MADEKRDKEKPLPEDIGFDPDDYIRTAVTYGRIDLVQEWLPHNLEDPGRITELVLFPAAMYGQLEILGCALERGEPCSWRAIKPWLVIIIYACSYNACTYSSLSYS